MRLFQEHLKLLFVPIVKLNHIINDSLEKFVLILHLVIKALEVHQLNIKHILLSMYKAYLHVIVKAGNEGVDNVNRSLLLLATGINLIIIGFIGFNTFLWNPPVAGLFAILFWLGFMMVIVGSILCFLAYIIYLTTFVFMSNESDKFKKKLNELYPDISLDKPHHKKISWKKAEKQGKKDAKKMEKKMIPKSLRKIF